MIEGKTVTAILLVAGNSTRYGKNRNKNFEMIHGKAVMTYSLEAFCKNRYIDNIIIGVKEEEMSTVKEILAKHPIHKKVDLVIGGNSRQETVYHCLQKTAEDIVIIHDGARPGIKSCYINQCIESMKDFKGATMGVRSKDTIKVTDQNNIVQYTTKRSNTWIIQTPQCFDKKVLEEMHKKYKTEEVTDDCMLIEKSHHKVKILEGDYTNIKITTYEDLDIMKGFIAE